MLEQIRQFLHASPFQPFEIRTSNGREYHVATADHAHVAPGGQRLYVYQDDGQSVAISALHIAAVAGVPQEV